MFTTAIFAFFSIYDIKTFLILSILYTFYKHILNFIAINILTISSFYPYRCSKYKKISILILTLKFLYLETLL